MRAAVCTLIVLLALTGCRASAPLAPKSQVEAALSDLGVACGNATQIEAFGGQPAALERLDSAAMGSAQHLIRIMRADPQATYLGLSMRRVVSTAASETGECQLKRTSTKLSRALD